MSFTPKQNNANWNTMQNDKYAWLVVFRVLSNLCIAGLIVVLGTMYINLNRQNSKLDTENIRMLGEYTTLTVELKNVESELALKGNVQLVSKAPDLNLKPATTSQIYILEGPSPFQFVNEDTTEATPLQVAGN